MVENTDIPGVPGYVSVKEAAKLINVSDSRMYEYVREKRLPLHKAGNTYMIAIVDLEQFKRNPTGRLREKPPGWRTYRGGGKLFTTDITVKIRQGQREALIKRLEEVRKAKRHTLTGTIARYVLVDRVAPDTVSIWLVWKDSEMPDEATHEQELAALRAELADVLDWETAQVSDKDGIIYT